MLLELGYPSGDRRKSPTGAALGPSKYTSVFLESTLPSCEWSRYDWLSSHWLAVPHFKPSLFLWSELTPAWLVAMGIAHVVGAAWGIPKHTVCVVRPLLSAVFPVEKVAWWSWMGSSGLSRDLLGAQTNRWPLVSLAWLVLECGRSEQLVSTPLDSAQSGTKLCQPGNLFRPSLLDVARPHIYIHIYIERDVYIYINKKVYIYIYVLHIQATRTKQHIYVYTRIEYIYIYIYI